MLRTALLLCGGVVAVAGALLLVSGQSLPGCYALGLGGVIVLGIVFERWRYRPNGARPGAGWEPTGERFQDPQTGKTVQVFYDKRSGERRYVSE